MPIKEVDEAIARVFRELEWKDARETLIKLGQDSAEYLRAHIELAHTIPSPSKALDCRRQMWYKAHGVKADRGLPESWLLAALTGVVTEPIWLTVLTHADPRLVPSSVDTLDVGYGVGTPDAEFRELPGHPLLELKRKTGWAFQFVCERGAKVEDEAAYAQAHQYMAASGRKWTLYLTSVADPSFHSNIMRKFKRNPNLVLPFYHVEWFEFDSKYNKWVTDRQYETIEMLRGDDPAPRDFNPEDGAWPCYTPDRRGGCMWVEKCLKRGA